VRRKSRRSVVSGRVRFVVGAAGLLVGIGLGANFGGPWLAELWPERFQVAAVAISGHERVAPVDLAATARVAAGARIQDVDLAAVRERLLAHPWVAGIRVATLMPDRVLLEVDERVPLAVAWLGEGARYVDRSGTAFAPAPLRTQAPRLVGVDEVDPAVPHPTLAQGVRILEAIAVRGMPQPSAVQLGGDDSRELPALVLGAGRGVDQRVLLGGGELDAKLARLATLLQADLPETRAATEIDLRFGDRVILRGGPSPGQEPSHSAAAGGRAVDAGGSPQPLGTGRAG